MKRTLTVIGIVLLAVVVLVLAYAPAILDRSINVVLEHQPYAISREASALHGQLVIGDLHADSIAWHRSLLERADRGHVDIPRMREGNAALQMFTTVTKTPRGQNYDSNTSDAADNITLVALIQRWPISTWTSLKARALFQAERLHKWAAEAPDQLQVVLNRQDLEELLQRRTQGEQVVGALIGTEGSHALDGELDAIDELWEAGFRMMSLQHFFDNRLGGSLHGESQAGLTRFGEDAVRRMLARGVMIDIAHSSENVVRDVLAISEKPLLVSHTGFRGHCDSPRNISDELMLEIARGGGLIGVGYWDGAICDPEPASVVAAIRYGIDLVGEDHVALGSDYDGSVETAFDISELAVLTHTMLEASFTETEIRKVMGGNIVRHLKDNLPQ